MYDRRGGLTLPWTTALALDHCAHANTIYASLLPPVRVCLHPTCVCVAGPPCRFVGVSSVSQAVQHLYSGSSVGKVVVQVGGAGVGQV